MINHFAIVAGGASGIGKSISKRFADNGTSVMVVDIDNNSLEQTVKEINSSGGFAIGHNCNVTNWESAIAIMDPTLILKGKNCCLINCVGIRHPTGLLDESEETWNSAISIMLTSAFRLSQQFIQVVKDNESIGSICNIGSIVSQLVSDQSPAYHVAKSGLRGLTTYLSVAAGQNDANVRVNLIEPGLIIQERHQDLYGSDANRKWRDMCQEYQPLGVVGVEDDIVNAVFFLTDPRSSYINGSILAVDGSASNVEQFSIYSRLRHNQNS